MRSTYFLGAAAALALIATDPAICAQAAPKPTADTMQPMPVPSQPNPPITEPLPPEMPVQGSTDAPIGPMATPPAAAAPDAQSGGTTSSMMQPVAATKEYPTCTKTLQDNCRNRGEGPKRARKPR